MLSSKSGPFIVAFFWISFVLGLICLKIIRNYHENKPLGMQTLLGKVIVICTNVTALTLFVIATLISASSEMFSDLVNKTVASFLAGMSYNVVQMFYLSIISVTLTKYLSIYHSTILQDLNEKQILLNIKIALIIVPLLITAIEFFFLTDIEETPQFLIFQIQSGNHQSQQGGQHYGYLIVVVAFLACALIGYVQFCIELQKEGWLKMLFNKFVRHEEQQQSQDIDENISIYKLSVMRGIMFICVVFSAFSAINLIVETLDFPILLLINVVVLLNICPAILILYHPGMKAQSTRAFSYIFSQQ